ncbi:uncharacterized protein tedc2 isoform 1-T1 [Synchiropus picturatus]
MALLASLEKAIKLCKEEQARLHSCIQRHRELLIALAPQPKTAPDESQPFRPAETDTSPGETEDLKLLEQALEKALRVRSGAAVSKNSRDRNKHFGSGKEQAAGVVTSNEVKQATAGVKRNEPSIRSTLKQAARDKKLQRPPSVSTSLSSKSSVDDHGRRKSTVNKKNLPLKEQPVSQSDVCDRQQSVTSTLESDNASLTDAAQQRQQMGISTDQAARWKLLKSKQNRLWDKVAAAQREAEPGRSRFVERMSVMFPEDRPCGSPDQIRALVGSMTHQGNENQTKTLLDQHSPPGATEPEWEAWDRWRPEGGCLYPAAANLAQRDGVKASLPLTICYRNKAELTELERLRMNVALLQEEVVLQQALLDALAAIVSDCSDPSVLRGLYSLLGEGGRRFPAIVLDCD